VFRQGRQLEPVVIRLATRYQGQVKVAEIHASTAQPAESAANAVNMAR
jgi:hypothetical protein